MIKIFLLEKKDFKINNHLMKLICGPMATISHPAFRILVEKFGGCDEYFNEMINAGSLLTKGPFEKFYINSSPCPKKLVWQLTGKNCEVMSEAAKILVELDGIGIDLNMGCSAPDVYRFGSGIAWMLKPIEETKKMVYEVYKTIENHNKNSENKKRFSVKLRLGDDDFSEDDFFDFCTMLCDCGVELITLHPRTKKEKLTRPIRYEYCQKLAEKMHRNGVKVYLNGNVKDKLSFEYAKKVAPDVDGIMISRASVQKPWIFSELKNCVQIKTVDMQKLAFEYIDNIEIYQPKEFWKTRLQRFFSYFSMNFQFSHYAQTQFLNAKDNNDLKLRLQDFFEKCPNEKYFKVGENVDY